MSGVFASHFWLGSDCLPQLFFFLFFSLVMLSENVRFLKTATMHLFGAWEKKKKKLCVYFPAGHIVEKWSWWNFLCLCVSVWTIRTEAMGECCSKRVMGLPECDASHRNTNWIPLDVVHIVIYVWHSVPHDIWISEPAGYQDDFFVISS